MCQRRVAAAAAVGLLNPLLVIPWSLMAAAAAAAAHLVVSNFI